MRLTEHEQRVLAQLELQFPRHVGRVRPRASALSVVRSRLLTSVLLLVVDFGAFVVGDQSGAVWLMLLSLLLLPFAAGAVVATAAAAVTRLR